MKLQNTACLKRQLCHFPSNWLMIHNNSLTGAQEPRLLWQKQIIQKLRYRLWRDNHPRAALAAGTAGTAGRCVTAPTPGKPLLSSFCQKPLFACPAVSGVQEGKQSQLEPDYSPPGFRWCEWEAVVPRQLPAITLSPGAPVCPRLGFRNDCIFFKFTLNENDFNQRWKKSMKFWL